MTTDETLTAILKELQLQTALLRVAHASDVSALHWTIRSDPVDTCIVETLGDAGPMRAGDLYKAVAQVEGNPSEKTVKRHVVRLEELGIVRRLGAGSHIEYELTGLVE